MKAEQAIASKWPAIRQGETCLTVKEIVETANRRPYIGNETRGSI
jgi:hypothetical protein